MPYATDPICGMQVDKATAVSLRQGATTYYFCCAGCRDRFAKLAAQPVVTVQSVDAQQAYTCPMHPEVEQVGPGTCPKCGMDLEPRMAGLQEDDGAESDMVSFDRRHNEANGHGNTDGPNDFCWTGTLLYDVHQLRWDEQLCDLFGVPLQALPTVRDNGAHFGETDVCGALNAPVPICGVMGDSQASLFAQRCFAPGTGKATFGTGTSILVNVGHRPQPTPGGACSPWPG